MNHSDDQLKLPGHLMQVSLEQDVVVGAACAFLLAGPTEAPTPSHWRTRIATRSRFSPVHVVFFAWVGDKPHGTSRRTQGQSEVRCFRARLFVVWLLVTTNQSFDGGSEQSRTLVSLLVTISRCINISNIHCHNLIVDWNWG